MSIAAFPRLAWLALATVLPLSSGLTKAQQPRLRATCEGHTETVWVLAISPDGKTVASGAPDNTIRLWDVASGKEQATLKTGVFWGVHSLAFSPDGKTLASGTGGDNIMLWDIASRKSISLLDNPMPKVQSIIMFARPVVVFSPDGNTLASGGTCIQEIRLWDLTTAKQGAALEGHDVYGVMALAFMRNGKILASVGRDGAIMVWDLATRKNTATRQIADWISYAAFSPDAKTLAAVYEIEDVKGGRAATEYGIKLWEVATGKEQATHKFANVKTIAFSPDGKKLAFGCADGAINLWDGELASLNGHKREVASLAFSADGRTLASGSADKTIKLWDVVKAK